MGCCSEGNAKICVLTLEDTPAEELHGGGMVRRIITRAGTGMDITFSKALLKPGAGHDWHDHPTQDEAVYILKGEGTMSIEGYGDVQYKPGMAIVMPRGVKHQNKNTSRDDIELVSMFTPALR